MLIDLTHSWYSLLGHSKCWRANCPDPQSPPEPAPGCHQPSVPLLSLPLNSAPRPAPASTDPSSIRGLTVQCPGLVFTFLGFEWLLLTEVSAPRHGHKSYFQPPTQRGHLATHSSDTLTFIFALMDPQGLPWSVLLYFL